MEKIIYVFIFSIQFGIQVAKAYELPVPTEIQNYVKTHMQNHEFLDTKFHDVITKSGEWTESELLKNWSLHLNFNGDGTPDWVGYLIDTSKTERLPIKAIGLYCICSFRDSYSHVMLGGYDSQNLDNGVFYNLDKIPPGTHRNYDHSKVVTIENESVMNDAFYNPVGRIYYWDGSAVQSLQTSD